MRRFIFLLLFFLFLSFSINMITPMAVPVTIKKGFYTLEALKLSPNTQYTVQNTSFNERVYVIIFNSNQNVAQSIRLKPQSIKYNLIPLQTEYKIVIVGEGEVLIE